MTDNGNTGWCLGKTKYVTNYSSCQHRVASVYKKKALFWPAASPPQLWQKDFYTVWFALMHRVTFHCNARREAHRQQLAGMLLPSSLNALQQHHSVISSAPKSVLVLAPWQTDWALSISVFQVRTLPWAVACFLTSWGASSHSSPSLMSPGLFWWWVSSCTAPDRIQIPKTVGMSYSPLSCKLSSVLHWSRYAWLLEYSAQLCSWFGSLCLSEIQKKDIYFWELNSSKYNTP